MEEYLAKMLQVGNEQSSGGRRLRFKIAGVLDLNRSQLVKSFVGQIGFCDHGSGLMSAGTIYSLLLCFC